MKKPMYLKALFIFLVALAFISSPAICQTNSIDSITRDTVTVSQNSQNGYNQDQKQDDEFKIFLLVFAGAAMSFMLGFVMLGMAAFLLLVLLIVLFVTTGIISTSILVGWANKSYSKGVKYFLMLTGSVCGITAGTLAFGLFCLFFNVSLTKTTILLTGGIAGLLGGLFLGYFVFKIMLVILKTVRAKWNVSVKDTRL